MAEAQNTGGRAPRKAAARKAPTPARTAVQPGAVEEAAVTAAAVRPSPQRASARAAAAMRGEPEPDVTVVVEPEADPAPAAEPVEEIAAVVPFHGRDVAVKSPTSEQLAIYRRLSVQFQALADRSDADSMPMEEALKHLDRAVRLVQSVLVRPEDREWIEDGLLDGVVTLEECTGLLRAAFKALNDKAQQQQGTGNRAQRRSRARLED